MANYYVKSNFPIITAITKANPAQVTTEAAHGLTTGDKIGISGVGGMTQVNNLPFTVTVIDTTNFTLDSTDSTGYTTYTGAGYVHKGPNSGTYRGPWLASTAFATGDRVISNNVTSFRMHECTTAGTSGATQPTFNTTAGNTTADNTVTWTTRNPTTWANATLTSLRIGTNNTASDVVYFSDEHKEVAVGSTNFCGAGSFFPAAVICADDTSGEPPTTAATTAIFQVLGAATVEFSTANSTVNSYVYGFNFIIGSGSNAATINVGRRPTDVFFESCVFNLNNTATGSLINLYNSGGTQWGSRAQAKNCTFKFGNSSQRIGISGTTIEGGSIDSGSSAITAVFVKPASAANHTMYSSISGFDMSAISSSANIFDVGATSYPAADCYVRDCKLPASWTGSVCSGNALNGTRLSLFNCDSSDTNYRIEMKTTYGTMVQETTIVRSGGATDGATALSWKMITTSSANNYYGRFYSSEIVRWNETTGSSITVTVETLTDNVTLKDDEAWLEVMYLGTSGYPLGTWISDAKASPVATAANQPTSSATWTTTGITTPVKQYLSVSFTPQEKGFIHARVCVGKASTTVYVDPKLTVS